MTLDKIELKFRSAFASWFKTSNVDFWSETNAPEELASCAWEIVRQELLPKLKVAAEALATLEHHTLPQHARVATAALNFINEETPDAV